EELQEDTPAFTEEAVQVLKFHGVYQQDDRDRRKEARAKGLAKAYQMMVRTRVPGGVVSPEGYLAHDEIAGRWGNGTLRVTTRQDFQLHGVLKSDLHSAIHAINESLMTTLGGCGDQERNIMCCPAPIADGFRQEVRGVLSRLVGALTPSTRAYAEIWIDGELASSVAPPYESEPLYGEQYLPRKFKTAVVVEGDNCIDAYSDDLALVAMRAPDGGLAGWNVLVGGSLGRTHNKPDTYAAVAVPMAFVEPDQVVDTARAVVMVQRDFGDRVNRRHARLKYLIAERGIDWFRDQVQGHLEFELQASRPLHWEPVDDHLGWHEQGDGRWFYGLYIENGRIADGGGVRLRTALRTLVQEMRLVVHLTPQQNVILTGIEPSQRDRVEAVLREHGVALSEELSPTLRNSMACPAWPTCGLAVAEAERALPGLIREIDGLVSELGLADERISWRMTGCPNGCARPYLGDVGFVGTTLGKYEVYLGGDFEGTRLNTVYARNVPLEEIPGLLRDPLEAFRDERRPGEGFGDFCHRIGVHNLRERFAAVAS
ncbi:MAG: NADPH-dependent assimilatory sulfite reductase hemoprotein subunit, partial [Candidatus Dormibacteraeota bacterium]|nr:NADPH-dependent assimilatory sulfite reductase hemoprotein subunit [Candidatus Dormibacteraeota bacterium]